MSNPATTPLSDLGWLRFRKAVSAPPFHRVRQANPASLQGPNHIIGQRSAKSPGFNARLLFARHTPSGAPHEGVVG